MTSKKPVGRPKPRKTRSGFRSELISERASEWVRLYVKHFELNFLDMGCSLPPDAGDRDYGIAAIRAMFQTLVDSGIESEAIAETVGRVLLEQRSRSVEWNSSLNQRRFELIDKEIQDTLTPAERIELAGLTGLMREHLESEANVPMEGVKALHRKLLELAEDKSR